VQLLPGCVTLNDWPATTTVPLRWPDPVLAAALTVVDPFPVPVAPVVTVNHAALLFALQAQVDTDAVTFVETLPPAAATDCEPGDNENEHDPAAWLRVNVWPPIEIDAARGVVV
jgi:hypothetical protein